MKSAFFQLLRSPGIRIGLITAIIFQLLFSVIWLTGYDKITSRIDRFHITVVNEDAGAGVQIAAAFKNNLKFNIQETNDLKAAMKQLDERKIQMVVHIPEHFTESIQDQTHPATIQYSVNESNPTMVKTVMDNVASAMTRTVNTQAVQTGVSTALTKMNIPAEQAGKAAIELSERVVSETNNVHPLSNFSYIMVPMMLVMASFTGSMLFIMEVHKAAKSLKGQYSRWTLMGARYALNIMVALVISTIGSIMVYAMGVHPVQGFALMWLFQMLYFCTFLFLAQLPFFLLGDAGAWINIALLSIQLLSSGATIPREVMSAFYRNISDYLPATYAVNGIMNIVTGGPRAGGEAVYLLIQLLAAGGAALVLVSFRKEKVADSMQLQIHPEENALL